MEVVQHLTALPAEGFFLLSHGRIARETDLVAAPQDECAFLEFRLRRALPGGKGGFGAMLRGSSSSKKVRNFDACRDLSGRRLRDVRMLQELEEASAAGARPGSSHLETEEDPQDKPDGSHGEYTRMQDLHGDGAASQDITAEESRQPVDVDNLKADMQLASEHVGDAVAEGLRAARALLKHKKGARSKKRKDMSASSVSQSSDPVNAKFATAATEVGDERRDTQLAKRMKVAAAAADCA
jgi:hypothetical protein